MLLLTTVVLACIATDKLIANCPDGYVGPNCDLFYPYCSVYHERWIGDGVCDGGPYDTEECGYDGGNCPCVDGSFGPNCDLYYPFCYAPTPEWIGDGLCDGGPWDTEDCGWDGGDCPCYYDYGYFGPNCDLYYPNCDVPYPNWISDGICDDHGPWNTEECGWDGGDCIPYSDCDMYDNGECVGTVEQP